jgi:hypothetical protein
VRFKRAESISQSFNAELHSNLASLLFERVQTDKQLVVLDIGLAMPTTVDLFANFKCKLIFVDLFSLDLLSGVCPEDYEDYQHREGQQPTHQQLVDQFTAALSLDPQTKIDICLFWDFFNYLDGTLLKAFIDALHPYISDSTCGYGLGVLNARSQLPNYQYGIKNLDLLHQYLGAEVQKPVYPHSQRDLNNLLGYFDIDKSRLMPDGRVEYFLSQGSDDKFVKKPVF